MISLYKPFLDERDTRKVQEAMDTKWISASGPFVREFEEKFAEYIGAKHAVAVSNGTCGLMMSTYLFSRNKPTRFMVPNLCYVAVPNTVVATPKCSVLFGDIDKSTFNLSMQELQNYIHIIDGVIFVYNYGHMADIYRFRDLCVKYNVFLIEDACEALGCSLGGRKLGTIGDMGVFSFFGNKTITCGEGGMVVTDDESLYREMLSFRSHGISSDTPYEKRYWHDVFGLNFRMTNLQAAIGVIQLSKVEEIIERKNYIYNYYRQHIDGQYQFPVDPLINADQSNFVNWLFSIQSTQQMSLIQHLKERGIEARPFFRPNSEWARFGYTSIPKENSLELANVGINIPSYPELTNKELQYVCECVNNFGA